MFWLLFLFLSYVRADDDSLDFGPPELPPVKNVQISRQMDDDVIGSFMNLHGDVEQIEPRGTFVYPQHLFYDNITEYDLKRCFDFGMLPIMKYYQDTLIWDNIPPTQRDGDWIRKIPRGTYYCGPAYSNSWYYSYKNFEPTQQYRPSIKLLKQYRHNLGTVYEDHISTADPPNVIQESHAAAASAAAAAATAAVAAATLLNPGLGVVLGSKIGAAAAAAAYPAAYYSTYHGMCDSADTGGVVQDWCKGTSGRRILSYDYFTVDKINDGHQVSVPFPVQNGDARSLAISLVKKGLDVYAESPATFCSMWNRISGNGIEYFRPPKAVSGKMMGVYKKSMSDLECTNYDMNAVDLCERLNNPSDDDKRQIEFIEKHPNLLHGDTLQKACNDPERLFCQRDTITDETPEAWWGRGRNVPNDKGGIQSHTISDDAKNFIATVTGFNFVEGMFELGKAASQSYMNTLRVNPKHVKALEYSADTMVQQELDTQQLVWVMDKIVEAQAAVMTWAYVDCKSESGEDWSPAKDFACLLGAHEIAMKGASQTIPVSGTTGASNTGFGVGLIYKNLVKRGVSFIIRGHYPYCVVSSEVAIMAGEKITLSPVNLGKFMKGKLMKPKVDAAKDAAKKAKETTEPAKQEVGKIRKMFDKCKGSPWCKAAGKTYGRENTRAFRQRQARTTGVSLKAIYEYWEEEGVCSTDCDFISLEEKWDLLAGSMSFFSAKTTKSRLRVWTEGSTGWYRHLYQSYAHVTIPNPVQIAFAVAGGILGVLAEFQISMETARGTGVRSALNLYGNPLTDVNKFGSNEEWFQILSGRSPINFAHTTVSTNTVDISVESVSVGGDERQQAEFIQRFSPTRFSNSLNSVTEAAQYPNYRRRLVEYDSVLTLVHGDYNVPDIAISETSSDGLNENSPIRLNKRGMVVPRAIQPNSIKIDSLIYGVQDDIQQHNILVNPFRYTKLDENSLELEYNRPPYHVIDLKTCEMAGFTSVHLLDHTFNSELKDKIFSYMATQPIDTSNLDGKTFTYSERTINFPNWKHDGSKWSYDGDDSIKTMELEDGTSVEVNPNDEDLLKDVVIENIQAAERPVGLLLGPLKENGKSDLRQTTYNLHGAYGGNYKHHKDCDHKMKCVCVYTSGYKYVKYGDIKTYTGNYMINPVYSGKECQLAAAHMNIDFTSWTVWQRYTNKSDVTIINTGKFKGCVKEEDTFYFYSGDGSGVESISDNSIVRLHVGLLNSSTITYSGGIINVYREQPFTVMKTIHPSIDDQVVGHHIFEGIYPVWFPKYSYNAIKDKNAHYTIHDNTFKVIRRVDRYYKRNKDVVEEYYIADDTSPTLEYIDLNNVDTLSNEYGETTLNPGAHFVANALSVGSGVIVPQMDFVHDGNVAFIGENIHMNVLPCRSLFDYTGDAKYCKNTSCEIIPGRENFICGEVTPPSLNNSLSCEKSYILPNTCPVGYGMDGDGADINGVHFKIGDVRQCAKCPIVSSCNHVCKRCFDDDPDTCDNPQACKECLSPSGSYRCIVDLANCDKPGYIKTYTRRGGTGAQVSTHCVKTFEEPDFLPWQASTLQKYHHEKGNPFYPVFHETDNKMYIQNELYSETRYLVCEPGFVPTQKLVTTITEYAQTCAGYTCERCPDGFYEKDQICMKCPNRQIASATGTGCEYVPVPKGHFFDLTNKEGSFITSCDHWLDHPGGSMGAYQDEENQLMCKTVNTTKEILGSHPVMFKGGIVEYRGESGWRVSQNRTQAVQCGEHQICNGEEVSGCKPGYIWTEFREDRDFDPCQECNANQAILNSHPERDNYEYCDGSHRFRCATASHTDATVDTFRAHTGNHSQAGDIFVGVRALWNGSNLVLPRTERRGDMYRTFDWSNEFNPASPRAEQYVYNANFKPRRYPENEAFNPGVTCEPVPNGFFALPDKWQKTDCGAARELCVHRTFHSIVPIKPNCADVPYYPFTSKAVKEECYDYIYRGEDRICTDGLKQSGIEKPETLKCKKDYCNIEGQSNCWCGDEEDFCTMGCVDGLCQEICGDRVCEEYEVCYGKFNQFESFARCAIKCQAPRSNFCVIEDAEGNAVFCRHYNEDWNSTIMQKLEPKPTGPCFDEVPSIPETQCRDVFDTACFCGREFFDPPHTHEHNLFGCHEKKLKPFCSVLQDDGTCIYETSSDGKCLCGLDEIDLTLPGSRCYSDDESRCGVNARGKPMCEDHVHSENDGGCIAGNFSIADNMNCYNGAIVKEYLEIGGDESYRCREEGATLEVKGCMDPLSDIHNPYATIPGKCKY